MLSIASNFSQIFVIYETVKRKSSATKYKGLILYIYNKDLIY